MVSTPQRLCHSKLSGVAQIIGTEVSESVAPGRQLRMWLGNARQGYAYAITGCEFNSMLPAHLVYSGLAKSGTGIAAVRGKLH
jgi:hypothetical protein